MGHDARAILAARNNADLYVAVFEAHGLRYDRLPAVFVGRDRPPPYYSNLTVCSPDRGAEVFAEVQRLAVRFGGTVGLKDSFCELDLRANGFETLFEAQWIWRAAGKPAKSDWVPVETEAELATWEDAWKRSGSATEVRMFPEPMLRRADTVFLGKREGGAFVAGCIVTISADCVGMSNVFALSPSDGSYAAAAAAVAGIDPRLPIVGYEAGADLAAAKRAGFVETGRLRVLLAQKARF
jgi:hypothetical protein